MEQAVHDNYWAKKAGNPFSLPHPPDWWLKELRLFDDKLVLFPSQKRATFILARKATRSAGERLHGERDKATGLFIPENPNTVFMHLNRLVRVCEIMPGVKWDQRVFKKLAAHDIQRLGGASAVSDRLEAMDAAKAATIQRDQESEIDARSHDAYKAYKYTIGERISMTPNPHGRGTVTKNRVSVHVSRPTHPPRPVSQGITLTDAPVAP